MPKRILSREQHIEAQRLYAKGAKLVDLASQFGVSRQVLYGVLRREPPLDAAQKERLAAIRASARSSRSTQLVDAATQEHDRKTFIIMEWFGHLPPRGGSDEDPEGWKRWEAIAKEKLELYESWVFNLFFDPEIGFIDPDEGPDLT